MKTYCGARTRRGTRCRCTPVRPGGKCRFHGGLSTGPVTERGRQQSSRNLQVARLALATDAHKETRRQRSLKAARTMRRRRRAERERALDLKLGIRLPPSVYGLPPDDGDR
jgi:hypothetical protein